MRSGSSVLRALAIGIVSAALVQAQPHYSYIVQTVAGSYPLGDGGPATSALMEPLSVISSAGGVTYVGEESGRIRKVSASSTIETLTTLDSAVLALTRDAAGILYASTSKGVIYQIDAAGHATRIAGGGVSLSDGIPATKAFMFPVAIVVDSQGRLIYAEDIRSLLKRFCRSQHSPYMFLFDFLQGNPITKSGT